MSSLLSKFLLPFLLILFLILISFYLSSKPSLVKIPTKWRKIGKVEVRGGEITAIKKYLPERR